MPAWRSGAWAPGAWAGTAWAEDGVAVPDVSGLSEAAAIAALEAEGFVVAIDYANSSTVAAGDVISQSPVGGTDAPLGSTVTISVSLGEGAGGFFIVEARRRGRR